MQKKLSDQESVDPMEELITYVKLKQQSKASKQKIEKIEAFFNENGKPVKKILPKVGEELKEFFINEVWNKDYQSTGISSDIKKEGRYFKRVEVMDPETDEVHYQMEIRSPEAVIAYLNKRMHPSSLKKLSFFPEHGSNVILHETSFESNRSGVFIWCFVDPNDHSSALNVFFSDEWTAREYALKNGFRIIDESGSYQSDDKTIENNEKITNEFSSFIFSFPKIMPIPEKRECTDSEKDYLFGAPCYDDNDIRSAKKRAVDQKSKFVDVHLETKDKKSLNKIPQITERVDCKRLLHSRCHLKYKISELQKQLKQTDAVLGLFGQNIESYSSEYGIMLNDYYGKSQGAKYSDLDKIVTIHEKLESPENSNAYLVSPSFKPKSGQKVRIHEVVVNELQQSVYDVGTVNGRMNYCFIDPKSPGKYQPVFFKDEYSIQREAFIKNYIIVDEEGFEVVNPITYDVYVLEDLYYINRYSEYN